MHVHRTTRLAPSATWSWGWLTSHGCLFRQRALLLLLLQHCRVLPGMRAAKGGAAALAARCLLQELLVRGCGRRRRAALLLARDRLRGRRGRLGNVPVIQLRGSCRAAAVCHQAQPRQLAGGSNL